MENTVETSEAVETRNADYGEKYSQGPQETVRVPHSRFTIVARKALKTDRRTVKKMLKCEERDDCRRAVNSELESLRSTQTCRVDDEVLPKKWVLKQRRYADEKTLCYIPDPIVSENPVHKDPGETFALFGQLYGSGTYTYSWRSRKGECVSN